MNIWSTIKGYVAGGFALIACPCHLPFTYPIILGLTAGTVLGTWLQGQFGFLFGILTVIFTTGLGLAIWWLRNDNKEISCEPRKNYRIFK